MRRRSNKGFTLIELLVVIVIISITAGIAVMTLSANQHKKYEILMRQMVNLFQLAEEESLLRSVTLGVAVTENALQFYEYQANQANGKHHWQLITQGVLKPHTFADSIQVTLKIQNEKCLMIARRGYLFCLAAISLNL